MGIVSDLSKMFQQNIGKVSEYANAVVKLEVAKKNHELELNNAFAKEATKEKVLNENMGKYIETVLEPKP